MIDRLLPVAALAVSYAALAVAAATGTVGGIVVAAAVVAVTEVGVARRWSRIERTLTKLSFGFARRRFTSDVLLVIAVVGAAGVGDGASRRGPRSGRRIARRRRLPAAAA